MIRGKSNSSIRWTIMHNGWIKDSDDASKMLGRIEAKEKDSFDLSEANSFTKY